MLYNAKNKDRMKDKIIKAIENNIKAHPIAIEYTADEILALFDVSQQRELLLAFFDLADELPMGLSHYDREKIVEEFLANNCG